MNSLFLVGEHFYFAAGPDEALEYALECDEVESDPVPWKDAIRAEIQGVWTVVHETPSVLCVEHDENPDLEVEFEVTPRGWLMVMNWVKRDEVVSLAEVRSKLEGRA